MQVEIFSYFLFILSQFSKKFQDISWCSGKWGFLKASVLKNFIVHFNKKKLNLSFKLLKQIYEFY